MIHFPLPFLLKQFLHFTKILLAFLHPNVARVLMECSVLDMLYQLNLSLLEIIFVYIVKMSQNERFSLSAQISSLQLVTRLPNSNKGRIKGHILVSSPQDGLYEGPAGNFTHDARQRSQIGYVSIIPICHLQLFLFGCEPIADLSCLCGASKNKRGCHVEWVEKASFDHLNKIFKISSVKQNHQVLLTDKNLQAVVKESQSFILLILLRLAPRTLVPDEHHVLKDFPFYEVAYAVDSKAFQDCLEQREKKRQDGMLRQAPTTNRSNSNSIIRLLVNKNFFFFIQPVQRAPTPPFASLLPYTSTSSPSSSSFTTSIESNIEDDLLAASTEPEIGVEPVVPPITWEEEKEEDMAANLRTRFKERQCKHLFKSIMVIPSLSKRPYLVIICPEPILAIASVPVPSAATTSIYPPIEEVLYPKPRRPSFSSAQLDDDFVECVAFVSPRP